MSTTPTPLYRIRPSTDPLDPHTAEAGFSTLHDTLTSEEQTETALQPAERHWLVGWTLHAVGDRPADWQTALTPFGQFTTDRDRRETTGPTVGGSLRVPLAVVCETLAATAYPVMVQLLVRPHCRPPIPRPSVDTRCLTRPLSDYSDDDGLLSPVRYALSRGLQRWSPRGR